MIIKLREILESTYPNIKLKEKYGNCKYGQLMNAYLISKPLQKFFKEFEIDLKRKDLENEIKICTSNVKDWSKTHNINFNKIIKRFIPFYDLGNGDIALLDKSNNKPVWFSHESGKVVDLKNKEIKQ